VICADSSSLPEVVGEAAMLFDPESSQSLAACLMRMLNSNGVSESFIEKGRERAARFSWSYCVSKTLNLYRELSQRQA